MSYAQQSVSNLLRGPLLHTPQGWIVLISCGVYLILANLFWFGAIDLPLGKNLGSVLITCIFWPFLTFLFFVRHNLPNFAPSWRSATFVAICAFAPIVYVCVYG